MKKELLNKLIHATLKAPNIIVRDAHRGNGLLIVDAGPVLGKDNLIAARSNLSIDYFPEHIHAYVEIVYMYQGQTTHIVNGETVILKEGEFLFINQACRHENLPSSEKDIAVNIIINPLLFEEIHPSIPKEESLLTDFVANCLNKNNQSPNFIHFKVSGILPLQNLAENLIWNVINDIPDKKRTVQATLSLMFLHLSNSANGFVRSYDDDNIVYHVLKYIDDNYIDGSLTDLAKQLFYDFNALSKQIKKQTGKNYTELVQEKRLSQACYFLKETEYGISEISQKIGYENVSYFHRLFYKTYGLSPKKYRDKTK